MKSMSSDKILVVEDEWVVAEQICKNLKEFGYTICSPAATGDEAIRNVEADRPDLILMDIVLKGNMDGIEAADRIMSKFNIPVVYLTAYKNHGYIDRAKKTKPFGYLLKPFKKDELHTNIEMALHKHRVDEEVKDYLNRLAKCYMETIKAVAGAIELRGPYTPGHHQRVAEFTHAIAKEMRLPDFSIEGLWLAAHVYDIGLASAPISIIQGAENLTGIMLTMYRKYPQTSYDVLEGVDFPWPVADIVLQHRECYDGSGFPREIKGENILIEARILAVAVDIEYLMSNRNYRNALPLNEALEEIRAHRGSKYDPDVVDACLRLFKEKGDKTEG